MSRFSADWLALREPLDARSRSRQLIECLNAADAPPGTRAIVDLGSGSGANLRHLAPRLGGAQDWLLVDNDAHLLEAVGDRLARWTTRCGLTLHERSECLILRGRGLHCQVRRQLIDLAHEAHQLDLHGRWLVTASALLDLVAKHWLDALLTRCRRVGARILFALTYDGLIRCSPPLADDTLINGLVNRHQTRDKGFGPALGPRAAWVAPVMIREHRYHVVEAHTPWFIDRAERALQIALLEGWAQAAVEVAPQLAKRIWGWRHQRLQYVAAGISRVYVGHRDLLAWPLGDSSAPGYSGLDPQGSGSLCR